MPASLADYWTALCPRLPPAWDTAANRASLLATASGLAPIPRIALECRLGDAAPRLDLQQCIRRDDGEPGVLREHLLATRAQEGQGDGAWAGLLRFCTAWADTASPLHAGVAEIFLEYDLDGATDQDLTPSVFVSLGDAASSNACRREVATTALDCLVTGARAEVVTANLARCFDACPPGVFVGYLGVMLGRDMQAVRVNVKRLAPEDLLPFLAAVGWQGSKADVAAWAAWAYDRVDRVILCLDIGDVVYPHVGLECVLAAQPDREPRWAALLGEVSARGMCTAANAAAYLAVPGVSLPPETDAAWPAPWIAATLAAPIGRFSTTERRLSHVKVTVQDGGASLKGYWGAGHVWREAAPRPVGRTGHTVGAAHATARAVAHLLAEQAHTGRWSDFFLPTAGESDEWVTAFVATCLLETGTDEAHAAAARAWRALLARRPDEPGWGYNRLTPADADSTAWALRLANALGAEEARVGAARRFLDGHVQADGGLTTYAHRDPIRGYTRLPGGASFAGWQAAHACVTAAAAPAVGQPARAYLANQQAGAGHWSGYWWCDDEYTTALAAEAVPAARTQAVAWAQARVDGSGAVTTTAGDPSAWATAWCVRILRFGATTEAHAALDRAVAWLAGAQEEDGSWPASARMRVPLPGQVDPAGDLAANALDENRLFTTAAAAAALSLSGRSRS